MTYLSFFSYPLFALKHLQDLTKYILFIMLLFCLQVQAFGQNDNLSGGGYWKMIDEIVSDEQPTHEPGDYYYHSNKSSNGSANIRYTTIKGGEGSISGTWTKPPSIISPDDTVSISLSCSLGVFIPDKNGAPRAPSLSFSPLSVRFDDADVEHGSITGRAVRFLNSKGEDGLTFKEKTDIFSAKLGSGYENGEKKQIQVDFGTGSQYGRTTGTRYIYEWVAPTSTNTSTSSESNSNVSNSDEFEIDTINNDYGESDFTDNTSDPLDDIPWSIVIGTLGTGLVAEIIRRLIKKKKASAADKSTQKSSENEVEPVHYILQVNSDSFRLNIKQPEILQIQVWKVTTNGNFPVAAQINIQNPEKNLVINHQYFGNGLTAQLLMEKQPSSSQFNLSVYAIAEGHPIQKQVRIIAESKMQIVVQTHPDNRRTLRPDTNNVLTCIAEVVDEAGKSVPELTSKIRFKPQSKWIDLSNPVMENNQILINIAASNPDPVRGNNHIPSNVTLSLMLEDVEGNEMPLMTDLNIKLLDCKLDTDIELCSFPANENHTEISINAFILNSPVNETWTFEAQYEYYNSTAEPLTNIEIRKKSNTEAIVILSGPIKFPESNEGELSGTLVISAFQGIEKPLERYVKVLVTKVGLFIQKGVESGNQISYIADGHSEREIYFELFKYNKSTSEIVRDINGLENLKFTLMNKEKDIVNFASVLGVSFDYTSYGSHKLISKEKMPGYGDVLTLTYLVEAPCNPDDNPEQFRLELQLKVKTFGLEDVPEWLEAYNNCKEIIFKYTPNRYYIELNNILETRKYTLGVEGLNNLRSRVWKIIYNLILAEGAEGYKAEGNWAGAIEKTLEWTEWAGDLAFNALVAYYMKGNPLAGTMLSMTKSAMIEALNYYIHENGTVEGFMDLQYQKIIPFLVSSAKGRLLSIENIEMVFKKNKPLAISIYVSCEFVYNLYQTKSVVEAAKITALGLTEEFIMQKITLHLHKNQLKYNIKITTVDDTLQDISSSVKTKDGKPYIELDKVIEIMRDPAQVRTLKNNAPEWLKKVFDDSRNEIYKKHDADLKKYISDTYKLNPDDVKIDDFRTPGKDGSYDLNTDRDYRVLRKVKTTNGEEIWIELQRHNWIEKSYEIFGEQTKKPYGISDKEWAERHLQRGTDRFDAEAGKDYSDHVYNSSTGEILKGEPNIIKVKRGEGTLYDAEGLGKMYQNKVKNALEPGTIPEAYAQAQKAVESLETVKKSYTGQNISIDESPQKLKDAMDVIRSAKTDVNATPESIKNLNDNLFKLGYNDIGEVADDIAKEFKNLKPFDNKNQIFNFVQQK